MNILSLLRSRFAAALSELGAKDIDALVDMVRPSQDPRFGDYQANCAMPLAKQLGRPPRDVAAEIVAALEVADVCEQPEIAGPGFVNLRLQDAWIEAQLAAAVADQDRLAIARADAPRTVVLDYSSPNVAKPMHVGHIRSTVIGAALENVLKFLGHRTISDNHIGDWGTQFGMILFGYKNFVDQEAYQREPVAELGRLYKQVSSLVDYHEAVNNGRPQLEQQIAAQAQTIEQLAATAEPADKAAKKKAARALRQAEGRLADLKSELAALDAKTAALEADPDMAALAQAHGDIGQLVLQETANLHAGDAENRALWQEFLPACQQEIDETYQRLGVRFDHTLGESFYQDQLASVVDQLVQKNLAVESDGAICVFIEGYEAPMIVQKKDGAFLYATTDLVTIRYRMEHFEPDAILYVVDHRQSLHFEQLFAAAKLLGFGKVELVHVKFGTVLGEDGRPYKTRSGDTVGLTGLLDEAVRRARLIVDENDDARPTPILSADDRQRVAEVVGIGAIKYADLAHNRDSDYVFSYDKMLATKGNTAAYMQYSYARVRSIFDRGEVGIDQLRASATGVKCDHPAERALALEVLRMAEALERVVADYRPNHLTAYLFDLAGRFAEFFEQCQVLKADSDAVRTSRLLLCDITARTLHRGLALLGIEVVEKM